VWNGDLEVGFELRGFRQQGLVCSTQGMGVFGGRYLEPEEAVFIYYYLLHLLSFGFGIRHLPAYLLTYLGICLDIVVGCSR
jgi:hypothetical protein